MENFDFSKALLLMKEGKSVSRRGWNNPLIKVSAQYPDALSKMTKPYLFMAKDNLGATECFPLDLSCESIFAEDWFEVTN